MDFNYQIWYTVYIVITLREGIKMIHKTVRILFIFILMLLLALSVSAEEAHYLDTTAEIREFVAPELLTDGNQRTFTSAKEEATITLQRSDGILAVYVVFNKIPSEWTISTGDTSVTCGQNQFLHEFVDIEKLFGNHPKSVTLTFPAGTVIEEVYAFSNGTLPDWVQIWEAPCTEADILLLSSHSDDEQLFFAGLLPLYAGERGLDVQVVYLVNHFDTNDRPHEQLDGLWAVGVRHYPLISEFPDLYSESFEEALTAYQQYGYTYDDFCEYITNAIRRFRPQVIVSHAENGEYSHGTHMLCSAALKESILFAADPEKYPDSATTLGIWDTKKTYLHLYSENKIVMNYDIPLESFGGKTAFEVSQDGFSYHKSQHWMRFYKWLYGTTEAPITKASQITDASPCSFGLYRSTVGADVLGGDFFENLKSYRTQREEAKEDKETDTGSDIVPPMESGNQTGPTNPPNDDQGKDKNISTFPTLPAIFLIAVIAFLILGVHISVSRQIQTTNQTKKHSRRK